MFRTRESAVADGRTVCTQFAVVAFIGRRQLIAWPAMRTRRCKRTSATPRISSFLPPMQDRCVHGPSGNPSDRIHAVQIFIRVVHLLSTEIYRVPRTGWLWWFIGSVILKGLIIMLLLKFSVPSTNTRKASAKIFVCALCDHAMHACMGHRVAARSLLAIAAKLPTA